MTREPWAGRIFTNGPPLTLRADNPDDGYSVDDLSPHGWAPGGYMGTCPDCSEIHVGCDKRCRRCRPCAIKALVAFRAKPPNKPSEFWWVEWCEGMPPEPARIGFDGDRPATIEEIGGYRQDLADRDVRLIERVLPAGRAAAAVERLEEIAGEKWPWKVVEEISAILQVEETQA